MENKRMDIVEMQKDYGSINDLDLRYMIEQRGGIKTGNDVVVLMHLLKLNPIEVKITAKELEKLTNININTLKDTLKQLNNYGIIVFKDANQTGKKLWEITHSAKENWFKNIRE